MNSEAAVSSELENLRGLDDYLRDRIRGQDHVIARTAAALRRGELGLTKSGRPKGSFLFLGPTGVGKTELTIEFTEHLLGRDKLFRFDMSEYQNQESLGLLLGSKSDETGNLGAVLERSDFGTLLFDEIEKAHPRVLDIFLQILDAARVTVATGQTLDLSRFYVVFTSNIGSAELLSLQHSSFATMERHVLSRAQHAMRPELFARISEKLVFNRLSYEVQLEIAELLLSNELKFLEGRGHLLVPDATVLPFLVRRGFHAKLGARPMRDTIEKLVGDAVSQAVVSGQNGSGKLIVDSANDSLAVN